MPFKYLIFVAFLTSCSFFKKSVFEIPELYAHYPDKKVYILVPEPYCNGCMVRTENVLRSLLSPDEYVFIGFGEHRPFLRENEHFFEITENQYYASAEYDYLMYAYSRIAGDKPVKFPLDTEESFEELRSLIKKIKASN
ncbi:hypothetical protein [Thermaurantimonas aggregans]|uniref:hypothetical protein n=1 Tax=Thermaurantimonas aggregans TaxID=2173829 RepID=UPI0023F045F7|nr:hypothetical protein [Thermaurantimonas aggregans]MCX8149367.1 hypothetical protein [Thermaurantimonas aggregans]